MSLTVLILAKNEEKNIMECIQSALFADEIIDLVGKTTLK